MQKVLKRFLTFALAIVMCLGVTTIVGTTTRVADAATDYYSGITATGGEQLLGQLHDLIVTTRTKYSSYDECRDKGSTTDPGSKSGTVMEFYTHQDIDKTKWDVNGGWNREHVWPKADSNGLWKNNTVGGGADLHHIRPAEKDLNAKRGNLKYGEVTNGSPVYQYGTEYIGGYSSGGTFQPQDNVKGDIARILMYVYTHYNTYTNSIFGGYATTNGSKGEASYFGTLNYTHILSASNENAAKKLLLQWNESDPVDEIETKRNDAVYGIQKNRNPFIDHPEYAEAIWGDGSSVTPTPTLQSIAFDASAFALNVGQSRTLTVIPTPSNVTATVSWTSSNNSVATVVNGKVTAVGEGTATITATSTTNSTIKATATVTVIKSSTPPPTPSDKFEAGTYKIAIDLTAAADVGKVLYFNGQMANNYYFGTSDNESNAAEVVVEEAEYGYTLKTGDKYLEVIKNGDYINLELQDTPSGEWQYNSELKTITWTVTASGTDYYLGTRTNNGKTYTTISANDVKYITGSNAENVGVTQFVISFIKLGGSVTPPALESIIINPSSFTLKKGESTKLSVLSVPSDIDVDIEWFIDNTDVATVAADGTVTAVAAGTATITAMSKNHNNIAAYATVTVTADTTVNPPVNPTLTALTITPASLTLTPGKSENLTVMPTPSNAKADVNWTSSDNSVATVDDNGTVIAIKAGTVTITATSKDNSTVKATITVKVNDPTGTTVDETKIAAFKAAVEAIPSNGTFAARLAAIKNAINAHKALSDAELAKVIDEVQHMNEAMKQFTDDCNNAAQSAESTAIGGIL